MESFRSDLAPSPMEDSQAYLEEAAKPTPKVPVVVPSKVKLNPINSPAPVDEKSSEGRLAQSVAPEPETVIPPDVMDAMKASMADPSAAPTNNVASHPYVMAPPKNNVASHPYVMAPSPTVPVSANPSGSVGDVLQSGFSNLSGAILHPYDTLHNAMGGPTSPKVLKTKLAELKKNNVFSGQIDTLEPAVLDAVYNMQQMADKEGHKIVITSGTDGKHSDTSYHYSGHALDFRVVDKSKAPGNDYYSKSKEVELARKYAKLAGFATHLNELEYGPQNHNHISWFADGYSDQRAVLQLNRRDKSQGASKPFTPSTDNFKATKKEMPATQYDGLIRDHAIIEGIPYDLFHGLIKNESQFNPKAVSPTGAIGLGQIQPETQREMLVGTGQTEEEVKASPQLQVKYSARYLTQKIKENKGNYAQGLAAYNAGQGGLDTMKSKGIVYPETLNYVARIMEDVDPEYTPANRLERAKAQILGKAPSPMLADYNQKANELKASKLQGVNETMAYNALDAAKWYKNPVDWTLSVGRSLGIHQFEKASVQNSYIVDLMDQGFSGLLGLKPGEVKAKLAQMAGDPANPHATPVQWVAGKMMITIANQEEMAKETVRSLAALPAVIGAKMGLNSPLPLTATQQQIKDDPDASPFIKDMTYYAPEFASMFVTGSAWGSVFKSLAPKVLPGLTSLAGISVGMASKIPLVGGMLGNSAQGAGTLFKSVMTATEHAPAIAADFATRGGIRYIEQTLDPNSPEHGKTAIEQFKGFLGAALHDGLEGLVMSAGPAVLGSAGKMIRGKALHMEKTLPAMGEYMARPEVSTLSKFTSGSLEGMKRGGGGALLANMVGLDKTITGSKEDIPWYKAMAYGTIGGGILGGSSGIAAGLNPKFAKVMAGVSEVGNQEINLWASAHAEKLFPELQSQVAKKYRPESYAELQANLAAREKTFHQETSANQEKISLLSKQVEENVQRKQILEEAIKVAKTKVDGKTAADPAFLPRIKTFQDLTSKAIQAEAKFNEVVGTKAADPKASGVIKTLQAEKAQANKNLQEFVKANSSVQADSVWVNQLNEFPNQLKEVVKSTDILTQQIEAKQYAQKNMEYAYKAYSNIVDGAVEKNKDILADFRTSGNSQAILQTILEETHPKERMIIPEDIKAPESLGEIDHVTRMQTANDLMTKAADNLLVRVNTVGDPLGSIMRAGMSQFGMEAAEVQKAHYPNREQLAVIEASSKKNGILDRQQSREALSKSKLNWENREARAITPGTMRSWLETRFPELEGLEFDPKGVSGVDGVLPSVPLRELVNEAGKSGDLSMVKQAYNTAKLAEMMGETAVPITGKVPGLKEWMTGKDKLASFEKALGRDSFEVEGGNLFGISTSDDLFDISATSRKLQSFSDETDSTRAILNLDSGKVTMERSAEVKSDEALRQMLVNLGGSLTDATQGENGLMKLKMDAMGAQLAELNGTGPAMQSATGKLVSNVGIKAISGDPKAVRVALDLIDSPSLTERDRGSSRLYTFQEEAGKRMKATKEIVARVNEHHAPIRKQMLESIKKIEVESGKPEQEFFSDVHDVLYGNQSLFEVTQKWTTESNRDVFKSYVESLNEASHLADVVARKNGNSQNLFSSYIADILYSDYAPPELLTRGEYGASTRLESLFEKSEWNFQKPKEFAKAVERDYEKLVSAIGTTKPKDFVKLPLVDRIMRVKGLDRKAVESMRENPKSFKWVDTVNEVDAMSFSPYFRDAAFDPVAMVSKKLRGAAQANNLGDFLQAGAMLEIPSEAGNPQKMVKVGKVSPGPGYRSLGATSGTVGISDAFTEADLILDGERAKGSEVWLHPDYAKALDDMFGFSPKATENAIMGPVSTVWKGLTTMLRQFALISGAQTFGSQMTGKAMSLIPETAYRASSSLMRGKEAMEDVGVRNSVVMDHAIKSGLNMNPAWALSSRIVSSRLANLTPEQKKTFMEMKVKGKPAANAELFFDAASPQSTTQQASSQILADKGVVGKAAGKFAHFASGLTAFDELEMSHGVMNNINLAMLSAFTNLEQSLGRTMGEQFKHLPPEQASAQISKMAAAIVNKNMGAHSEFMGGDGMQKIMQNLYTTPGIQYSRLQQSVEFLDTLFSVSGFKSGSVKSFLDEKGILKDRYSHYPKEMQQVLKERTLASLANLTLQVGLAGYVYNVAHNGVSPVNHPEGKHFHLSSGDGTYYTMPEVFGAIKSTLKFWDEAYGRVDRGESFPIAAANLLALNETQKMNPFFKIIGEKMQRGAAQKSEIHSDDVANIIMNGIFGDTISGREVLGLSRDGNILDAFKTTAEGGGSRNKPRDQMAKDIAGMSASNDSSDAPIAFAAAQKKAMADERWGQITRLQKVLKNDDSKEDQEVMDKIGELMTYDMAEHPNPKIAALFKDSPDSQRIINLENKTIRRMNQQLDPGAAIEEQGDKPGAMKAYQQFETSKGR